MRKVLCVCFGNTCRSPMMQMLLQQALGQSFKVESAGIRKGTGGQPANDHSITCMGERGLDLTGHVSRWIGELDLIQYSYIICVGEAEAQEVKRLLGDKQGPKVLIANEHGGGVSNPYQKGIEEYRKCAALLDRVIPEVALDIRV